MEFCCSSAVLMTKCCRYAKKFSTIEPTVFNVCEYWFNKDKGRIHDIRSDTLAQMMNLANIRPGGKYLAVDDASGLIASSILARMDGELLGLELGYRF